MIWTLHASTNKCLYKARIHGVADIEDTIRAQRLETITSPGGSLVFWFSPYRTIQVLNHVGVEMLLAASDFTARDVPLLYGGVVVSGRDAAGRLASLTDEQMRWLINVEPGCREDWVLSRRFARAEKELRRRSRSEHAALEASLWEKFLPPSD
ncbi:hypothetical protein [Mycolicibacterium nivoides]|uniref:Uncharacterized protein n=1 Tax=Mycolicibacterium nivoides TaxID=2487344 RepID=A0ABW9LLQ8_9MYCO